MKLFIASALALCGVGLLAPHLLPSVEISPEPEPRRLAKDLTPLDRLYRDKLVTITVAETVISVNRPARAAKDTVVDIDLDGDEAPAKVWKCTGWRPALQGSGENRMCGWETK